MMETEAERLRAQGLTDIETVGEILEQGSAASPPYVAFDPARLEGYIPPVALQPGIHFGVPEEIYHAFPALSNGGIKELAASPMIFWQNCRWMNPDWEEREEKDFFDLGHAYECRILEGEETFAERYTTKLDRRDYPDALVTGDDIKKKLNDEVGVKPKGASKAGWMEQLREWFPEAQLWEELVEKHKETNAGKVMIPAKAMKKIAITARIVELDPAHKAAVSGGYAQMTLIWHCPKTGVLMKARPDKMLIGAIVDAKTLVNQRMRSAEAAAFREIADRRYTIQPSVYLEGAAEVRKLVRADLRAVFHHDDPDDSEMHARDVWAEKWAANKAPDEWLWLFLQTAYPITRLVKYPRGINKAVSDEIVSRMKRRFKLMTETFGCDPWLDLEGLVEMSDEDIPNYALEI